MNRFLSTTLTVSMLAALLLGANASAQGSGDASDPAATAGDPVVLRVGDQQRTLSQFERRFEVAIRGVAAQQGLPMSEQVRAQLEPLAPRFLEQRADEIALLSEADSRGLEVASAEVDEIVAQVRGEADDAEFAQVLESSGIGDLERLRTLLKEGALIDLLRTDVAAEVEVEEAQLRDAFEARPDSEEVAFDEVRSELAETVRQQLVQQRLIEIADAADTQTFPERLPYAAAAPAPAAPAPSESAPADPEPAAPEAQ